MPLALRIFSVAQVPASPWGERVLEGEPLTIGRSAECTLSLPDPGKRLSRVHLEFVSVAGGHRLKVASARASVHVNGSAFGPGSEVNVRPGDYIAIGDYLLEIVGTGAHAVPGRGLPGDPAAQSTPSGSTSRMTTRLGVAAVAVAGGLAVALLWPQREALKPQSAPVVEPIASAPRSEKESPEAGLHRKAFEQATDAARGCLLSGDLACAETQLGKMKLHSTQGSYEDAPYDARTIESVVNSLDLARQQAGAAGERKTPSAQSGPGSRSPDTASASAKPAPPAAIASTTRRTDPLSAYALCMIATYGELASAFSARTEAAARARIACTPLRANLERELRTRAGNSAAQVMQGIDAEILRSIRTASK